MQKIRPSVDSEDRAEALALIAQGLEPEHFGKYVMIDPLSEDYVVASTISEVHLKFIEAFGPERAGHCLRIGASPFAAA